MTARSPEDVLAVVPVVLGFAPTDSLVLLTFGGRRPFHARIDLPREPRDVRRATAALLEPASREGVRQAVLVAYTDERALADSVCARVADRFTRAGIDVLARLAADGTRWWHLPLGHDDAGTTYDVAGHPFRAEAVWHGLVTHRSREDLAATLAPDPEAVAAVATALARRKAGPGADAVAAESAWVVDLVRHGVRGRKPLRVGQLARLVAGLQDLTVRDAAWSTLRRPEVTRHVDLWTAVVRRCPESHVAAPATLLGVAAWASGRGALARCAVQRALTAQPGYTLAVLLEHCLDTAVPPTTWDDLTGDGDAAS